VTHPHGAPERVGRVVQGPAIAAAGAAMLVADRLEAVEEAFRENLASPLAIIDEIGQFVAAGGGKRVRPILHLLCARMCGYQGRDDVVLATVLEFIHSATLIHDDIIDEATTRRGRPSANYNWGNNTTVLFGDYLFAKAMSMALTVGSLTVMETLADVTLRMTEGEMLQTRYEGRIDLTEEEYLGLVERKTAALFGACCELGAIIARVDEARRRALRQSGIQLGIAFQLVDDLLDFTGDAKVLGKPAASDLREGKVTLALIDLLATGPGRAHDLARAIMDARRADLPEIAELGRLLEESGAIERTRQRAHAHAERAIAGLELFEDGPERRALSSVADLLVFRER
jgi:octaprenyl-diphosphate synthase